MKKIKNMLILRHNDYTSLTSYINNMGRLSSFDRHNTEELIGELKKATVVNNDEFPPDVVGLNSKVRIKTDGNNEEMELIDLL